MLIIIYSGLCQLQCCKCFCWKATVQQRHEYRTWFCTSVSIRYSKTDIKHEETKMILGFFCVLFFIMSLKEKAEKKMKVEVSCSEIPKTLFKNKLLPHIRKYINIIKVGCCDSPSFPFLKSFMKCKHCQNFSSTRAQIKQGLTPLFSCNIYFAWIIWSSNLFKSSQLSYFWNQYKFQFPMQQNWNLTTAWSYLSLDRDETRNLLERSQITISEHAWIYH